MLGDPAAAGQVTLEYLERANLFVVPLDNDRRWYRYHHLFADLLRQRLHQRNTSSPANEADDVAETIVAVLEMSWVTGQTVFADGGLALHSPIDAYGQVQRLMARRQAGSAER